MSARYDDNQERIASLPPLEDDDYQPGDEFDWDRSDPKQYCKHGTFIGSHWGPDLLCPECENE